MPNFEVTATANVQPGVNGLKQVQAELAKTAVASQKMDSAIVKTGNTLNTGLKTGANQATAAMTNLGRVVQDAPFGFIGIANNLNPLIESFQRLKVETGSTGGALKALSGSLMGAGGLGFAVSIVSSLMTVFAMNAMRNTGNEAETAKKKIKSYAEVLDEIVSSVSKEAAETTTLIAVLKNENETRGRKLAAIEELKKIQPEIFEGLRLEKNAVIGLDEAYKAYLLNFKNVISAKLIQGQIEEKLTKILTLQGVAQTKEQQQATARFRQYVDSLQDIKNAADPSQRKLTIFQQQEGEINALNRDVQDLITRLSELSKGIKLDAIKVKPEKIQIEGLPKLEFKTQAQDQETAFSGLLLTPQVLVKPDIKFIDDPVQQQKVLDGLNAMFAAERLAKFQATATEAINATIGNIVNDSIGTMADAIGQALAGGKDALPNLFESLIRGVGSQIKELGKYLVKIGVQMLVAKEAVKALGLTPQGAIIAGIGLQVLAGALQAAFSKKIQGFATGVRDFGGGFALVGERGPELVNLPRGSGVTPNNEVSAYGGGSVVMIPSITLRGTDLVIAFNRASQQMSRTN